MDLSKILAISGKPGLYKSLSQSKNGFIVESLADGKRFTAFTSERISALEEISIFTDSEDVSLKEVFKSIWEKKNGQPVLSGHPEPSELKAFFEEILPNYDKERVYVSDMKKVVTWYNTLLDHKLLDFTKEEEKKEEPGTPVTAAEPEPVAGEETKPVKKPRAKKTAEGTVKKTKTKKEKNE
jgi:hypothetical protein